MKNSVRRTAKKFIKSVKGNLDFESIEKYLNKLGYQVMFFDTFSGDKEIIRYNLEEEAKNKKAFTYNGTAKIIFIDNNVSSEDKKYLLYHETAHILLGHLNFVRFSTKNNIFLDIEADTFVHEILNPKRFNILMPLLFILVIVCSFTLGLYSNRSPSTERSTQIQGEFVYITTTGIRFHTSGCIHTKDNNCARIDRTEAEKIFQPCDVCNP